MFNRLCMIVFVVGFAAMPSYAQKIYWAETLYEGDPPVARHLIRRANPDGSNIEDAVDCGQYPPYAIALDPPTGDVYWTRAGTIYRANLGGSPTEVVLVTDTPWGVAIDCHNRRMYWTYGKDFYGGIRSANLDGSGIRTVREEGDDPERVAVDSQAGKVYWTLGSLIRRSNLDGSQVQTIVSLPDYFAWGVTLDLVNEKLYWTVRPSPGNPQPGKVQRANLDGTNVEDLFMLGQTSAPEVAVHPHLAKFFWTDEYAIRRANLDGSKVQDIVPVATAPLAIDFPHCIPTLSMLGAVVLFALLLVVGIVLLRRRAYLGYTPTQRDLPVLTSALTLTTLVTTPAAAWQDTPDVPLMIVPCSLDSGIVSAPGSGTQPVLIFSGTTPACASGSRWIRLHFDAANTYLSGPPGAPNASYLILTSLPPNGNWDQQKLDAVSLPEWSYTTAYFKGDTVRVELFAYPGTGPNRVKVDKAARDSTLFAPCGPNTPAGICGPGDERVRSSDPRAARFRYPKSCSSPSDHNERICSTFLVRNGANWLLSAGHCCEEVVDECEFTPIVEFGVPDSSPSDGHPLPAPPERQAAPRDYCSFCCGRATGQFGVACRKRMRESIRDSD